MKNYNMAIKKNSFRYYLFLAKKNIRQILTLSLYLIYLILLAQIILHMAKILDKEVHKYQEELSTCQTYYDSISSTLKTLHNQPNNTLLQQQLSSLLDKFYKNNCQHILNKPPIDPH
jgi:hypothetical protein